ncbi:MAG TPA: cytochrome d ubiquinol oxidase subunit II [Streptosporangiaceae bacterium]
MIPFWFILITVLWLGFFVLEGFDFGVGILHGVLGRNEAGRRTAINSIGPLWDGNEVWLIVAVAAMFAAFPAWYATMLSGFYPLIVALLAALIVRGLSFEYRGKRDSPRWRRTWDGLMTGGSLAAPFLIGLALGDLLHGVPISRNQEFAGSLGDLFPPYAIFAGLTLTAVCVLHGATFLALKTAGEVRARAGALARRGAPVVALAVAAYAAWTHATAGSGALLNPVELAAVVAAVAAAWLAADHREGWAFAATTVTMAASVLAIFVDLYPRVMVATAGPGYDLTVRNTASGSYSLGVMTVVAVLTLPFVLGYQAWSYYVFRRRLRPESFGDRPERTDAAGGGGAFAAAASATVLAGADPGLTGSPASDSAGPRAPRLARPEPAEPESGPAARRGSHRRRGWRLPGLGRRSGD